jgi:outer membrane immunogenic protein
MNIAKLALLTSFSTLVLASGSALAADMGLPVKTPLAAPPPVPVINWTGCYINGGAGYGMYRQDHQLTIPTGTPLATVDQSAGGSGWLGTVGGGCDYQFSAGGWGNWVVGAFADYDFMDLRGNLGEFIFVGSEKENWAWAAGGRIGYVVTPAILAYFNGGFTSTRFGDVNFNIVDTGAPSGFSLGAQTFNGGFIGGGTEVAITAWPGLFWRSEYRYSSYKGADLTLLLNGGPTVGIEHETKNVQTITSSLVWKFNWTGR